MSEASDFKLAHSWGLPKPIIKSHPEKKWLWPWAREAPQNLGFFFNISAMAEDSDFKFGTHLDVAKATLTNKGERGRGIWMLPNIWGSPLISLQWLKLATSNLVHRFGLPIMSIIK